MCLALSCAGARGAGSARAGRAPCGRDARRDARRRCPPPAPRRPRRSPGARRRRRFGRAHPGRRQRGRAAQAEEEDRAACRRRSKPRCRTIPRRRCSPTPFFATAKAAERYAAIVDAGGWPTDVAPLRPGAKGPAVADLRQRLAIEGDLDAAEAADGPASAGLGRRLDRRGQALPGAHGIASDRDRRRRDAEGDERSRQRRAASSSPRARDGWPASTFPSAIATSSSTCPRPRSKRSRTAASSTATSRSSATSSIPRREIAAHISVINLNPTWTVPTSIIKKEIIPKMQKDPGLSRAREDPHPRRARRPRSTPRRINWATERAANYTLRQDLGAGNSLGAIRIGMPNKLAVYMHDTPSKRLFGSDYRFLSHGCVRVQGVYDLRGMAAARHERRAGRRLGQGGAAGQDEGRRARGHQARAARAGDLGLSHRLGEPGRRRQFPRRRLWRRRGRRGDGQRVERTRRRRRRASAPAALRPLADSRPSQ